MFSFESKIRFSEVDQTGELRMGALINYFQDCNVFQSESLGLGIANVKAKGKAWVLNSWQIEVERYPRLCEEVCVETWPTGFKGPYGTRNYRMRTISGEILAQANSLWVFMDITKGRPIRAGEEDIKAYELEEPLELEEVSRKITFPEEMEAGRHFTVLAHQIDTNVHMNNSQYISMAAEVLPACAKAKRIRVEYKKSAVFEDVVTTAFVKEAERSVVKLADEDGKPYAVVEFR